MATLPTVAGDDNTWGQELNDFLSVSLDTDGTLRSPPSASSTFEFASTGAISAAATTFGITNPTKLYNGAIVAVDAFTSSCEVRRVTGISGSTVTVGTAFALDHSSAVNVFVLNNTFISPEWFGCKPVDSTFDSHAGLMQAMQDMARNGNLFGLTGHGQRYYTSRPLSFPPSSIIQNITFTAYSSFSINAMTGTRIPGTGETAAPDQFFGVVAQTMATVSSVDAAANTITLSSAPSVGNRVLFYPVGSSTLPAPLEAGRNYYVLTSASNVITVSTDYGGSTFDITDTGTGSFVAFFPGFSRAHWQKVTLEGQAKQGLNGLLFDAQQPTTLVNLRIQDFPGPQGGMVVFGQQADIYELEIIDCTVGMRASGMQFLHIFGYNFEICDRQFVIDTKNVFTGGAAGNVDLQLFGGHWETGGQYSSQTQTITGNASVSAGTFTLSFNGETTGAIAYNASAATIQTALEALTSIDPGDVVCSDITGGLPSGNCRMEFFGGQYAWLRLLTTKKTTVQTGGLTGGVYTMDYNYSGGRNVSVKGGTKGLMVSGAEWTGTGNDFLTLEATAATTDGYMLQNVVSTGQSFNFVNDIPRGITVPVADSVGASERLGYFQACGYHGGTVAKNWWLGGRLGGHVVWDEYGSSLALNSGAKLRVGSTGTAVSARTVGATSVADGGTVTHGLGTTPILVTATPSVASQMVSVTALGSTTFTVAIKKDDGTAGTTQTIYWEAVAT